MLAADRNFSLSLSLSSSAIFIFSFFLFLVLQVTLDVVYYFIGARTLRVADEWEQNFLLTSPPNLRHLLMTDHHGSGVGLRWCATRIRILATFHITLRRRPKRLVDVVLIIVLLLSPPSTGRRRESERKKKVLSPNDGWGVV